MISHHMDPTRLPPQATSAAQRLMMESPRSNSSASALAQSGLNAVRSAQPVAPDEAITAVLALQARLLPELPEPVQLRLRVAGAPTPICFNTASLTITRPVLSDEIEFDAHELKALVLGIEADRIWHADFLGICFEKWRRPTFQLTAADALSGANPDPNVHFTVERALRRLCAEIVRVDSATPARAEGLSLDSTDRAEHEAIAVNAATRRWHVAA